MVDKKDPEGAVPHWPALPPHVADVLEPELADLAEAILTTIGREVPEYARPLEGSFGRGIRVGVSEALGQFVALIREPGKDRGLGREIYVALGRGEFRQGRSLDSLQAAYRIGAGVAWQRLSAAGQDSGLEPAVLYRLASAIFAYIDELSSESVEGYALEQSAREGARELQREILLRALLAEPATDPTELERLADDAGWTTPSEVVALACGAEGQAASIARSLSAGSLAGTVGGIGCVVVSDPDGPGMHARMSAACKGKPAALGQTVTPAELAHSWEEAAATFAAMRSGALEGSNTYPERSEERLVELVLLAGRSRLQRVLTRRLQSFEEETPQSRGRLITTLRSYLRHQGRIAPVAADLHVHPQTVRYRVARLRELLGDQLDQPESRFEIEAALRLDLGSGGN